MIYLGTEKWELVEFSYYCDCNGSTYTDSMRMDRKKYIIVPYTKATDKTETYLLCVLLNHLIRGI